MTGPEPENHMAKLNKPRVVLTSMPMPDPVLQQMRLMRDQEPEYQDYQLINPARRLGITAHRKEQAVRNQTWTDKFTGHQLTGITVQVGPDTGMSPEGDTVTVNQETWDWLQARYGTTQDK